LPLGEGTLIGTTDLRFEGPPHEAVATEEEIAYLLEMANSVMPKLALVRTDVAAHYCGVRPLPYLPVGRTGAIPRGHAVHTIDQEGIPLHTLIGGKLTTWRSFGEEVADLILGELGQTRRMGTRERVVPGVWESGIAGEEWIRATAERSGHSVAAVRFAFELMGTSAAALLERCSAGESPLPGLPFSAGVVEEMIRTEWVTRLGDLVERRLSLV